MTELYALVAYGLTGHEFYVDSDDQQADNSTSLLQQLDAVGWSREMIRDFAHSRWAAEEPWPLPITSKNLQDVGPAQWYATLLEVRAILGLDSEPQQPSQRTQLTPAEQRYMDDRPPHHLG
ncbi:MAG: hypothetical protein FWG08_01035 [Propionibacteriaceae bacterium]|nr:hypothetical protein [Propionibacteriaceae bacterium]